MSTFLEVKNVSVFRLGVTILHDLTWKINQHERWVVLGETGAGKTSLLQALEGNLHLKQGEIAYPFLPGPIARWELKRFIRHVSFKGNLVNNANRYYQQRYNLLEEDQSPTVREYLGDSWQHNSEDYLRVEDLLDVELVKLSNGQTRKIQLVKALVANPYLLLLDNPFAGLDYEARAKLRELVSTLLLKGQNIILSCTHASDIPTGFTHVVQLRQGRIRFAGPLKDYTDHTVLPAFISKEVTLHATGSVPFQVAVSFRDVFVRYGNQTILNKVSFQVLKNEKWALTGSNGSGKSTLLSLINADNPQAYANHIVLFDEEKRKQPSWKLKRRVAYFSTELHAHFNEDLTVQEVLSTGISGTYIPKKALSNEEQNRVQQLLQFFNRENLLVKKYLHLSSGEQQLALFLRVFMHAFDLLILDEPFQAFDEKLVGQAKVFIDQVCRDKTLMFVSHYPSEFPASITHVLELNKGSIVSAGRLF